VARLTGTWNRVEAPQFLSRLRVEGGDRTADAELAAAEPDDHAVLHGKRCNRQGISQMAVADLRCPHGHAAPGIDRHQVRIERAHEERVAENRKTTIVRSAAHADVARVVVAVHPEHAAGRSIERHDVIGPLRQEHDPVDDERGGLPAARIRRLVRPGVREGFDVQRRDLRETAVTVARVVASVHHPVLRLFRRVEQALGGNRRLRGRLWR